MKIRINGTENWFEANQIDIIFDNEDKTVHIQREALDNKWFEVIKTNASPRVVNKIMEVEK